MPDTRRSLPEARREDIVVQELPDETLVYDLKRHKALCLNRAARLVWKCCNGRTNVAEMALLLERELRTTVGQEVVWFALERLEKAHLLQERLSPPSDVARLSRRELVRMGFAAIAVPVILSVVAPRAAQAATCLPNGKACTSNSQCCSNKCQSSGTSFVCRS